MGQYHKPVNLDACEFLHPHPLGSGLKAWEIVANSTVPAAIVGLISVRPGNGPADIANNKMVGRWAGHRILCVGDYASDDDIPDFDGPPLSKLYMLCDSPPTDADIKLHMRYVRAGQPKPTYESAKAELDAEWQKKVERLKGLPIFTDLSIDCRGLIEQALSIRFVHDSGWATWVSVTQLANKNPDGSVTFELANKKKDDLEFLKRIGVDIDAKPWNRPPLDQSWSSIADFQVDAGQRRVLANLDRREYIDPVAFGEVPTTAGIMAGAMDWGSANAMTALLFQAERRGFGDLYSGHKRLGTWAGGHLIATSEMGDPEGRFPTTDEVIASFANISDDAIQLIAKERDV